VVMGQFDCGSITGLNRAAVDAYSRDGTRLVCTTIDPRRIRLVAGLRQGCGAPPNPGRTQRTTNQTRVHTGIVGRTSTNERWQAEDCGRRMTDKHPKRPGGLWQRHPAPIGLSSSSAGQFDCGGRTAPIRKMQATIDRLLAVIMSGAVAVIAAGTVGYIAHYDSDSLAKRFALQLWQALS
jgi:hypothetical protein